jgi:hypothetical protein
MKKVAKTPTKLKPVKSDVPTQTEPTAVENTAAPVQPIEVELTETESELLQSVVLSHNDKYKADIEQIRIHLTNLAEKKAAIEKMETDFRQKLTEIGNEEVAKVSATITSILALSQLKVQPDDIIYAQPFRDLKKIRLMLKSMMA